MKKFFSYLLITLFCINIFGIQNTSANNEKMNYTKSIIITKGELNKTSKGRSYVKQIDNLYEKIKDNEKLLNNLNNNIENLLKTNSIKNKEVQNTLIYLHSIVNIGLIDLQENRVQKGDNIYVHYIGKFENGEIFDSSYDLGSPLNFKVGENTLIAGFENAVLGMKIGETKKVTIFASDAYGEFDPKNKEVYNKSDLIFFEEVGYNLVVGTKLPTYFGELEIIEADETTVTVDLNHPMAGKNLVFEIELVNIKKYDKLILQVIADTRDDSMFVDIVLDQLKELPSINKALIVKKDFSETGVSEYLLENNINELPAFIFSTSNFDTSLDPKVNKDGINTASLNTYLSPLPGGDFILPIGATYNPFIKRSERGFLLLEEGILEKIKENSYTNGNKEAEITWLEFSDFGCAFCVKMHADDKTPQKVMENFGDKVNTIFMHMPFRNMEVAKALECIGNLGGEDLFNDVIKKGFESRSTTKEQVLEITGNRVSESDFNSCISENKVEDQINFHMDIGQNIFKVSGTPNNVLINNKTGEYEVLAGAYPYKSFDELINRLIID